jgi:sortase B
MKTRKHILVALLAATTIFTAGCSGEIEQNPIGLDGESQEDVASEDGAVEEATEEPAPDMLAEQKKLYEQNKDTIGWIEVPGTNVDNVIVQKTDEAEDEKNTYYLDKDFSHQKFRAGTIFMDYRDVFSYKEDEFSENLVLYGHNMADNTMFGSLRRYRQDLDFYQEAPFIKLSSNYKEYEYVIFGLVITSGDADNGGDIYADPMTWSGFPYWNMEELDDTTHFNYYINTVESMNMIDNVIDVKYGDQLLTLSTCYSDEDNSRFLIVARQFRDGETEESLKKLITGESSSDDEDDADEEDEDTTTETEEETEEDE